MNPEPCVPPTRYLSSNHHYSLAASDRQAVYLWDVRVRSASAAELPAPAPLVSGVQTLAGTSLVCAVTEQQQVGGSSGLFDIVITGKVTEAHDTRALCATEQHPALHHPRNPAHALATHNFESCVRASVRNFHSAFPSNTLPSTAISSPPSPLQPMFFTSAPEHPLVSLMVALFRIPKQDPALYRHPCTFSPLQTVTSF